MIYFKEEKSSDYTLMHGHFVSPFVHHLPGILPKEAELAHFQVVLPREWRDPSFKPMCIHMAGTGDHVIYYFCFSLHLHHNVFRFSIFGEEETLWSNLC